MFKKIYLFRLSVLAVWLCFSIQGSAQNTLTGIVRDSATHESLPYAGVLVRGVTNNGTATNDDGHFTLKNLPSGEISLRISSVGYKEKNIKISIPAKEEIVIDLAPDTYLLEEVVVKRKREKYDKNSAAVALARKLIGLRDSNNPENNDFYNYERYEKMTFALNDFSDEQKKKWLFKKFQFIFDYVDTSEVSGKPILTVSIKEKIENSYFRKDPYARKQVVSGIKRAGIDEMFNQESMQQFLSEVFKEVDIYGNDITLMLNRFVSPLSNIGPSFYKYYLMDSVFIDGEKCIDLSFTPFSPQSFGFSGHLYITADSTYFIKKVKFSVPKDINLNYVENLSIEQTFKRGKDGERLLTKDDMIIEFQIAPGAQQLYARRTNTYKNHSFAPPVNMAVFDKSGSVIVEDDAELKPDAYWDDNRHIPIKAKENAVEKLLVQLRSVPVFFYLEKFITILVSGYIETGENSKFDFGPMNTTISGNTVEGARFRMGGGTTANLNPHLFTNGYLAYGTRDGKLKYKGEVEYAFNKKKYHTNEFPIHSVKLSHMYDIDQLGQQYLYTNKDNVFLSLKRKADNRVTYLRKTELGYTWEHSSGFSYRVNLKHKMQEATRWVQFIEDGKIIKDFSMAEAELRLRYAPNEKYYQTKQNRYPISKDAPIFTLNHTAGVKGVLGGRYALQRTELGVQKRFWFSAFGYTDILVRGGKVWNKAPYPLLILPNANLSYTIQPEGYSLMNAMEFINDQFVSWDVTYYMNGLLLNRIPLIKYLKLREVVNFKGLYGSLSDKNNPAVSNNKGLFEFPHESFIMGKEPYMEASVGIENIFKILRIDYVWRLTYRNNPNIDRSGVRIALHFAF